MSAIKTAIKEPQRVVNFASRILKEKFSGRPRFDEYNVSGSSSTPEFAREVYSDATLAMEIFEEVGNVQNLLEVGCGYGKMTPWFNQYTENHYSIEPEDDLRMRAKSLNPGIDAYDALADDTPFDEGTFGAVVTWGVLMHVPPDMLEDTARELERVCSTDGTIIVQEKTAGTGEPGREWVRSATEYGTLFDEFEVISSKTRDIEPFREADHENTALVLESRQ